MTRREWSPYIPGTDIYRIQFLLSCRRLASLGVPTVEEILSVASLGVLSIRQVARISGTSLSKVRAVFDAYGLKRPSTRGYFDIAAIDGLVTACRSFEAGKRPSPILMQELTLHITPLMMETLLGVPVPTYWYHRRTREAGDATPISR